MKRVVGNCFGVERLLELNQVARRTSVDRNTFESTMQTLAQRTPFRPFTVALVNGDRLEIDHPRAVLVREGVAAFIGPGGIPAIFDHEGVAQVIGDLAGNPSP